jgi:alpha-galactosidase
MGDLVNTMAPIHIKQDSLIHNVVSKFVRLDGEVEDYTIMGQVLNKAGVRLSQTYAGTGFGTNTAIYQDFDARVYMVEEVRSDNYDLHGNI